MSEPELKQRLAAILAADVAGYSRLMSVDDQATVMALDAARAVFRDQIEAHHGRVIDMAGDSVLAVFETANGAVSAAIETQRQVNALAEPEPPDRRMRFRIGLHLGDVIEKADGTVYGDGVNIAARLEGLAEPGGITISGAVHGAVRGKFSAGFEDQGEQSVKNIAEPVRAYRVRAPIAAADVATTASWAAPGADSSVLALPDKPSIAVLPFTNMSADPDQEFFSDGISEDITTELSRYSELFVIGRNSAFHFKNSGVDTIGVGQRLGVRYLLEGSVRKSANRVRVTAQLIDTASANQVWAERYDRELLDIFEIQDELTRTIVSTVKGRVDIEMGRQVARRPIRNLSAYECVLRGQSLVHTYKEEGFAEARKLFEAAIALDAGFARAYGWLVYVETFDLLYWRMSNDNLKKAIQIGEAGLALDEDDCKCHLALGNSFLFNKEHDKAEHHLNKASSLNPNDDLVMIEVARFKMYTSAPSEGTEWARRAMRQNPYHPNWYWNVLARCLHTDRDYRGAIAALGHMESMPFWSHGYLAACHAELGQLDQARKHVDMVLSQKPDFSVSHYETLFPYRDPAVLREFFDGFRKAGFSS